MSQKPDTPANYADLINEELEAQRSADFDRVMRGQENFSAIFFSIIAVGASYFGSMPYWAGIPIYLYAAMCAMRGLSEYIDNRSKK